MVRRSGRWQQCDGDPIVCRQHKWDSGSTAVQVAQLSARVAHLTPHLQANRKDLACQRGLQMILARRKKMLRYLYETDKRAFAHCVRSLNIRNPLKGVVLLRDDDETQAAADAEAVAEAAAGMSSTQEPEAEDEEAEAAAAEEPAVEA